MDDENQMDLSERFKNATKTDLDEADEKIAKMEKELADMKTIRRLIAVFVLPPVSGSRRVVRGELNSRYTQVITDYLKANGPASATQISKACGVKRGSISFVLSRGPFEKRGFLYSHHGWEK